MTTGSSLRSVISVRPIRLGSCFITYPADVAVEETLTDRVGVLVGIGVSVVSAVTVGPPADRAFDGAGANSSKVDSEGKASLVRAVSPKAVVSSSDAEASVEVIDDSEHGRLPRQRDPVGADESNQGNDQNEGCVEPVDVLVPVGQSDRLGCDVRLLAVVGLGGTHRNIVGSAIGEVIGLRGLGAGGRSRRRHVEERTEPTGYDREVGSSFRKRKYSKVSVPEDNSKRCL